MQESAAIWSLLIEPGDQLSGYLRDELGVVESLEIVRAGTSATEISKLLPEDKFLPPKFLETLDESLDCYRRRLRVINLEKSLAELHQLGGSLITPDDTKWPIMLSDLGKSQPPALWVLGDANYLNSIEAISVVGSRLASDYGLGITRDLVRYATANNWQIISGGALGIDAMAHESAIKSGGKTIAVMAGGLDRLYPKQNLELFEAIRQNGLLVSEMPPGIAPSRWRFLQRNRLIAAFGRATVVIEAGYRSGSINTAGHANELGRPVGAIPGRIDSVRSAGCHRLIRESRAELIATPSQLAELMGERIDEPATWSRLSAIQTRALDAVGSEITTIEEIATNSGLTLFETNQAALELTNLKLLIRNSAGWRKA